MGAAMVTFEPRYRGGGGTEQLTLIVDDAHGQKRQEQGPRTGGDDGVEDIVELGGYGNAGILCVGEDRGGGDIGGVHCVWRPVLSSPWVARDPKTREAGKEGYLGEIAERQASE